MHQWMILHISIGWRIIEFGNKNIVGLVSFKNSHNVDSDETKNRWKKTKKKNTNLSVFGGETVQNNAWEFCILCDESRILWIKYFTSHHRLSAILRAFYFKFSSHAIDALVLNSKLNIETLRLESTGEEKKKRTAQYFLLKIRYVFFFYIISMWMKLTD